MHNVLPIQAATNILKYYVKFSNDFGDIIKNTFTRARDISKIHTAKTMAYSLMAVYKDCVAARDAAQEAAGNDETVAIDLSPLRVRTAMKRCSWRNIWIIVGIGSTI